MGQVRLALSLPDYRVHAAPGQPAERIPVDARSVVEIVVVATAMHAAVVAVAS